MGQAASTTETIVNKSNYSNQPQQQAQSQNKNLGQPNNNQNTGAKYEYTGGQNPNPNVNVQINPNHYGQNQMNQIGQTGQIGQNPQIIQKPKFKAIFSSHDLLEAFKTFAIDGKYLNQPRFNDTIEKLFSKIDIPSMHYTFLSERIYLVLDESRDGKISEEEFLIGMKNVMVNRDFRLKCKFLNFFLEII
jgi:hypothetical protein